MELVSPQDGGNDSPSIRRAQVLWLSSFFSLLALRAAISLTWLLKPPERSRGPSNRHSAKMLTVYSLSVGYWMAKVCGLGNLGVDFRLSPNFNRLE